MATVSLFRLTVVFLFVSLCSSAGKNRHKAAYVLRSSSRPYTVLDSRRPFIHRRPVQQSGRAWNAGTCNHGPRQYVRREGVFQICGKTSFGETDRGMRDICVAGRPQGKGQGLLPSHPAREKLSRLPEPDEDSVHCPYRRNVLPPEGITRGD